MNKQPVISLNKVSKSFFINREEKLKRRLSNLFAKNEKKFSALKNITFKVYDKEKVGLYGPNGSGKTTILKLIAGILMPDSGHIKVKKKVASVIELGTGLHPELSGAENIFLYSSILNIPKNEVKANFKKIIDFSELKNFIATPIKKYSTGMRARLAFAIALFSDADILLLDEVLSVGDVDFREKGLEAIKRLKNKKTIVFTTHNFTLIQQLCDRMFYIKKGRLVKSSQSRIKQFLKELDDGSEIRVEATSNSMRPAINKGNKILVKKTPFKKLQENDIVAFTFGNISEVIIHRIVKTIGKKQREYLTKGDFSFNQDPWILQEDNYLGKVIKVEKN